MALLLTALRREVGLASVVERDSRDSIGQQNIVGLNIGAVEADAGTICQKGQRPPQLVGERWWTQAGQRGDVVDYGDWDWDWVGHRWIRSPSLYATPNAERRR
jgi:hypothetical protein